MCDAWWAWLIVVWLAASVGLALGWIARVDIERRTRTAPRYGRHTMTTGDRELAERLTLAILDGDTVYILRCPGCDTAAYLDADQAAGRVSADCPNCPWHETHDFATIHRTQGM